jgi:hypothetical protein
MLPLRSLSGHAILATKMASTRYANISKVLKYDLFKVFQYLLDAVTRQSIDSVLSCLPLGMASGKVTFLGVFLGPKINSLVRLI